MKFLPNSRWRSMIATKVINIFRFNMQEHSDIEQCKPLIRTEVGHWLPQNSKEFDNEVEGIFTEIELEDSASCQIFNNSQPMWPDKFEQEEDEDDF